MTRSETRHALNQRRPRLPGVRLQHVEEHDDVPLWEATGQVVYYLTVLFLFVGVPLALLGVVK